MESPEIKEEFSKKGEVGGRKRKAKTSPQREQRGRRENGEREKHIHHREHKEEKKEEMKEEKRGCGA